MKSVTTWIIVGFLLRLILMPITVHPDLRGHYLGAYFIANMGDLLGVYDHISHLPRTDPIALLYHDDFLVYSPLTYWVHAIWLKIASPLINFDLYKLFVIDMGQAQLQPGFPFLVFILKLPYLFADAVCFWLLLKLIDTKHHLQASILWAFNLPLLHSAFMMGQFDIFLVLFILLALYHIKRGRPVFSAISLALAAGFKPFSLVLIPFLPGKLWKNLAAGLFTYFLIIAPYLPSPGFRMYALVAEHSDKLWFAKILVSGSQYLPLFMVGLIALFWYKFYSPKSLPDWIWPMTPLLLFYSVTHFHPQWFSWITPFLVLGFIYLKKARPLLICILLFYVAVVFSFESSLNFGLFGINFYPTSFINHFYSMDQLMSFVRGALASTCLTFIVVTAKFKETS